ncbi:MAG: 4-hydroxythreonine-4-phosphate dehydrogenase PdxA [Sphingopyxis sp.]
MEPFLVTLGDPAGIGPEVTARAWAARQSGNLPSFVAIGDAASVQAVWDGPIAMVDSLAAGAAAFANALPVWQVEDSGPLVPGEPTLAGAHCALHSLELGVGLARAGDAAGLITAPICKDQLYQVGFTQAGQTEFIADRCGVSRCNAVMMLSGPGLRVVPITVHVPMRDVPALLTTELIVAKTLATARGMAKNFGIEYPRLAIAGFNPHAGENGALGREEIDIITPAVLKLRAEGVDISGPHSPDALFTPLARAGYDAALCMYHDQALIPLKALYFDEGVNLTLGLPIVRTSPDHGTAFGIAGTGQASAGPMIAAIRMAGKMATVRAQCEA